MAIDTVQERHRPGLLKQQNKPHKHGQHRSKRAIDNLARGRVSTKQYTKKLKRVLRKDDRRNQALQYRQKKRDDVLNKKRQLGTAKASPFLVAIIPLASDVEPYIVMELLENCDPEACVTRSVEGLLHISIPRFKQRYSFFVPDSENMYAVLDSLKVADTVVFVTSALSDTFIDESGESILTTIMAQGLPSTSVCVVNMAAVPQKKRSDIKSNLQKVISKWLLDEKILALEKDVDAINLLRKVGSQKQRRVAQRDNRPHLLAEGIEFVPNADEKTGTLKVSGYLRGHPLTVNSLIHIPGWGSFQMNQIDSVLDPHPLDKNATQGDSIMEEVKILYLADPSKQETLNSESVVDSMDAEQTWPTDEDFKLAEEERRDRKLVKKVPKGMSDYQACWIPDCDAESIDSDEDDLDDNDDLMNVDVESEENSDNEQEDSEGETESSKMDDYPDEYDKTIDMNEEEATIKKIKEAKLDEMYPDEIDTPQDTPARVRFQKYRGLASFRTSPWDPKENLPRDYARLFQFENFDRTRKRVLQELDGQLEGAMPGVYITIHVSNVPKEKFISRRLKHPLILYGMLPHEQKMSVVNLWLKRTSNFSLPIKSKEELVFQCGYRRYKCKPIFSQHTNGTKHKYERYFQPNGSVVATMYAPIIFPPATVLVYKENKDGSQELVATGKVLSVNPDRLVVKRVVLSGHPYRVHKKMAVIRFMFFNKEDIDWFKVVELRTKYGRRGHIKESLGTHGHMKCVFDGQLKSQDTVLMYLYKRVFPKWSFDPDVSTSFQLRKTLPTIIEEDEHDEDMD